jgi:hypothetical protein
MNLKTLNKRLDELEKIIRTAGDSPIWIDGKNNVIRVDVNHKRGKPIEFPSTYEARIWLEKQINKHSGGIINYGVDNLADLHEDAETLRALIRDILPAPIVVPDLQPRLRNGQIVYEDKPAYCNHSQTYSADQLPGTLALGGMPAGAPADLRVWCLASLITEYFSPLQFKERYKTQTFTEDDELMCRVCLVLYAWKREGKAPEILTDFYSLFHQLVKLPVPVLEAAG